MLVNHQQYNKVKVKANNNKSYLQNNFLKFLKN